MDKIKFFSLLSLLFLLSFALFTLQKKPQLLSFQGRINPDTLSENYQPDAKFAIFNNKTLAIPSQTFLQNQHILGEENQPLVEKRIEVDITNQHLYAFENNQKIFDFVVSTGTWDRTPNGDFKIWTKIRSQKMSGGSKKLGTYYYLPNVPYILFFYNDKFPKKLGFSLHGTYWHNNFGVPMSHGCINMKTPDVEKIFAWATLDTPIKIYGKYETKLPSSLHL